MHLPRLTAYRFYPFLAVSVVHLDQNADLPFGWTAHVGEVAVGFFFTLSGLVLALNVRSGPVSEFWWRRVARIYPAALGGLLLGVLAFAVGVKGVLGSWTALATGATLTQAWSTSDAIHYGFNGPEWTLSCEAFCYVVCPLVLAVTATWTQARLLRTTVLLALAIPPTMVALMVAWPGPTGNAIYYAMTLPPVRLPEFVVGVVAGTLLRSGWRLPFRLGHVLTLYAAGILVGHLVIPWGLWALATLPGTVLVVVAAASADLRGLPGWITGPRAVHLGELAFSLYLVHWPVVKAAADWIEDPWLVCAASVLATTCLGVALHRCVELPAQRFILGRVLKARRTARSDT